VVARLIHAGASFPSIGCRGEDTVTRAAFFLKIRAVLGNLIGTRNFELLDASKPQREYNMSCREVTEFLTDYLDGSLPLRQRVLFRIHLLGCGNCRRYLDSFETTIRNVRHLGEARSAHDVIPIPEELVRAILSARDSQVPQA